MVSKAVIFCAVALMIQTTFGQSLRNFEVTNSECGRSSSSSKTRTSSGSGSVRAIGIGSYKGGKFGSSSSCSNTESSSTSSSSSESSNCNVCNAAQDSCNTGLLTNSDHSEHTGLISNAHSDIHSRSSSNSGLSISNAGYRVINTGLVSGGPFIVSSVGPVAPSGISVSAYNDLIGNLVVSGQLPFLSAVAFDGAFQHAGTASVAYGCGDGNIAIQEIIGAKPGSCGYIL